MNIKIIVELNFEVDDSLVTRNCLLDTEDRIKTDVLDAFEKQVEETMYKELLISPDQVNGGVSGVRFEYLVGDGFKKYYAN